MKRVLFFIITVVLPASSIFAQDDAKSWQPTIGITLSPVPAYSITGTDTSFVNAASTSPVLTIRNKSGLGISYSPKFILGGTTPGIFAHVVSLGIEQYDKKIFDYALNYTHYFFTNNKSIPYSPLTNEIYASFNYKKPWLRPALAVDFGFGTDTETSPSSSASDFAVSARVSHELKWKENNVDFSFIPALAVNGGTDNYFSLLNITKYIGSSKNFSNIVKKSNAAARRRNGATTNTGSAFDLNNIELGFESSAEIGSFSIRPEASIYLPVGSSSGTGTSGFWQLCLEYNF
jgi:hypothetical protein